jgi:hypothetical protein
MTFTVYKCDAQGNQVFSYPGEVIHRDADSVCVRALFQRGRMDLGYVVLKPGDVFTEWFYSNRWYNVFQVEDVDSGLLKGFYCNLTRPAIISDQSVRADDLELDLFVYPDGRTLLLDEDEYNQLPLTAAERIHVERALLEIHKLVQERAQPFTAIQSRPDYS